MKKFLLLSFLLLFISGLSAQAQDKIYFPYFELVNMEKDSQLQHATSVLLKTYIEENHNYLIILPKKGEGMYPKEDFLESIENAKRYGAKYVLSGVITKIGKVAVVSLSLFDASTGNRTWSDMIKGMPLDDFDPVLSRIGRNFYTNVKANEDADIYDVTTYEQEREGKLLSFTANNFTGILLGGNYVFSKTFNTRFGLNFYYDISSVILHMKMDYSSNTLFHYILLEEQREDFLKSRTGGFEMGADFPFTKTKNAFYVSSGLNFSIVSFSREQPKLSQKNAGLDFIVGGGYLIGRNSTANARIELGLCVPTYKVGNELPVALKFGVITSFANYNNKKKK